MRSRAKSQSAAFQCSARRSPPDDLPRGICAGRLIGGTHDSAKRTHVPPSRVTSLNWQQALRSAARPRQLPVLAAEAGLDCPLTTLTYPTILSFPIWLTTNSRGTRVSRV